MTEQILTAYVERVRGEHRELQGLVHQVRRALALGTQARWRDVTIVPLVRALEELKVHMEQHFAQEEAGGYLEEALVHAPRFTLQAESLLKQHPQLQLQMNQLLAEICQCRQNPKLWPAFAEHAQEALKELLAHEASENQLLERAYNATLDIEVE
jgi:hypothetical protein